jgi:hypothetical protein
MSGGNTLDRVRLNTFRVSVSPNDSVTNTNVSSAGNYVKQNYEPRNTVCIRKDRRESKVRHRHLLLRFLGARFRKRIDHDQLLVDPMNDIADQVALLTPF